MEKAAAAVFLAFTAVMIILFGVFVEYAPPDFASTAPRYPYFQDVHVMIFIGFGFLMSFLHRGGFTATSHAFLVAAYAGLWAMLNRGFWSRAISEHGEWTNITLSVNEMIGADFCAGAVLISFGAMLGRVSATQMLTMMIIEVVVFSINEAILLERYHIVDVGGSMVIHAFGAYFGVACSFMLELVNKDRKEIDTKANGSSRVTDTMAMVGTLFLFCFWPSFNAAPAILGAQDRTVVNTILSIAMSCVGSFLVVCLIDAKGRFGMVEIQNSTIAGGVAIGASADLVVNPFGAMLVGLAAGALSVAGYRFVTPALEKVGLKDTCGVHNLHGMPGVLAAIVSAIAVGASKESKYFGQYNEIYKKAADGRPRAESAGLQMAGLFTTLGLALVGGAIAGVIIAQLPSLPSFFEDKHEYHVPDEEEEEAPKAVDEEMGIMGQAAAKDNEPTSA